MRRAVIIGLVVLVLGALAWVFLRPAPQEATTLESTPAATPPVAEFQTVDVRSQDEGLTLTGVVKDGAGKPVPGADVFLASSSQASVHSLKCHVCGEPLLSCRARETAQSVEALLAANRGELNPAAQTVTDAKGNFRFEHLAGVSFTVWAHATGFGDGVKERAAPGDPVELFLPAAALASPAGCTTRRASPSPRAPCASSRAALAHVVEAQADADGALRGEGPRRGALLS